MEKNEELLNWIKEKLFENGCETSEVYKLYDYALENISNFTYGRSSFERKVREVKNKYFPSINESNLSALNKKMETANMTLKEVKEFVEIISELKNYYGNDWKKIINFLTENKIDPKLIISYLSKIEKEDINEVDMKEYVKLKTELNKVKEELSFVKKQNKIMLDFQSDEESFVNNIQKMFSKVATTPATLNVNVVEKSKSKKTETALLISDIHYQEIVKAEEMNNINEYNPNISRIRLENLFNKSVSFALEHNSNKFNIFFLGDILSGLIHKELRIHNDDSITIGVKELSEFFIPIIDSLKNIFDEIKICCVVGNHSRMDEKPSFKAKALENYEFFFYNNLHIKYLNDPKVKVEMPKSAVHFVETAGLKWKLEHGDQYTSVNDVVKNSYKSHHIYGKADLDYDVIAMGHFHKPHYLTDSVEKTIIVNGSVIGGNNFSAGKLQAADDPFQYSVLIEDGKIKYTYLIPL